MNGPQPFQTITSCDIDAMRKVYCPPTPTPTPTPSPTPTPIPIDECDLGALRSFDEDPTAYNPLLLPDPSCCNDYEMAECLYRGGVWIPSTCTCVSPIVVDVLGNGFDLTDALHGVLFDIVNDGVPKQVSWTAAGSDDAWLALDRNGNGTIDKGRELFGSSTPQPPLQPGETKNGFRALAVFDRPNRGGNGDGKISWQDAIFSSLFLWQDLNHNGVSESGELRTISELGLRSIDLDYAEMNRRDSNGNWFRFRSRVRDTQDAQLGRWAWDVFLKVQ